MEFKQKKIKKLNKCQQKILNVDVKQNIKQIVDVNVDVDVDLILPNINIKKNS
jgi:hypothetical protein